jgi:hypothetical protein
LAKFEPKIFLRIEALGKITESRGFLFLREEVGKKPRQAYSGFSKAFVCLISMNLKEGKRVEKAITFRIRQIILLLRSP